MKTKSINLAIFIPLFFSHFLATENLPKQHFLLEILVSNFATKEIPYHAMVLGFRVHQGATYCELG
jgi:hypothetical protein